MATRATNDDDELPERFKIFTDDLAAFVKKGIESGRTALPLLEFALQELPKLTDKQITVFGEYMAELTDGNMSMCIELPHLVKN